MTVPTILRLKIDRFRGLEMVDWRPSAGLNLILGGGDVGKTTILRGSAQDGRDRIVQAAAKLVASGGAEAATTRAVAAAAGVQAPTIYRLFGDKHGLIEAVAEHVLAAYAVTKAVSRHHPDPMEELRNGWDRHIEFGLANPAIFALTIAATDGAVTRTAQSGIEELRIRIRAIARVGSLRVSEERAVDLIHAAATGTILTLLQKRPDDRKWLSITARDAVFTAVFDVATTNIGKSIIGAASSLRAFLPGVVSLSSGERLLMEEWLTKIASNG